MESSDSRRQSGDSLPSIEYIAFERTAREGAQFHQRHPSIAQNSLSTASPISPTTMFGPPPPPPPPFSQQSQSASNGYISPPDSRRTSDNEVDQPSQGRQSLPSLHEAILDRMEKPFTAPSPLQTPPIGSGSFSSSSTSGSHMPSMPRSQPPEVHTNGQSHAPPPPPTPQVYPPPPPPPPVSHNPPGPPPPPVHHHDSSYGRREPQEHTRSLQQNPYSQTQPPSSIPSIRHPEPYAPPPPGSSSYQSHPYTPSHQGTSPQYPPTPSYSTPPGPPPNNNGYPFPQHPASTQSQPPYHPQASYPYPRDAIYQNHENIAPPQTSPGSKGGLKRPNGYGSTIERALSLSAIRRDLETIKDHSARIYYIVQQYQEGASSYPGGLDSSVRDFNEALQRSYQNTEALRNCHNVFMDLSSKEFAEQNAQKMNTAHTSEYGEDSHSYPDEARTNGSQQPDTKKIRRGRAAPPGRCHSCHRAETPEWRRGPDGARTLCNACGLHYAKLTRKLSKSSINSNALATPRKPHAP